MPNKAACHPSKCDIINDFKLFPTVYHRIFCHKFLTLFNQMLHYISKSPLIEKTFFLPLP